MRAVLFDVDGTLYHQNQLRALMTLELGSRPWFDRGPSRVRRLWRVLKVFRQVREELRTLGRPDESLDDLQYTVAAERADVSAVEVREAVAEWLLERPLKYMKAVRRRDLVPVWQALAGRGVEIGVFSDYPVLRKLDALGVRGFASVAVCATDPAVNAFKPHPAGFLAACSRWGLEPGEVIYVGDRVETDAVGAAAAQMESAILGASQAAGGNGIRSLSALLGRFAAAGPPVTRPGPRAAHD